MHRKIYILRGVKKMTNRDILELSLEWRHNGRYGVSNHQPHDCVLNRLFKV